MNDELPVTDFGSLKTDPQTTQVESGSGTKTIAVVVVLSMGVQVLYCQGGESVKHDWELGAPPMTKLGTKRGESIETSNATVTSHQHECGNKYYLIQIHI
jgi:hypothetical protein